MKYMVLGGAGFIGSHLVDALLKEFDSHVTVIDGHSNHITVIDDFSEGKYANLPHDPARLSVYDVSILKDVEHLFDGIDIVFHLAALTRPQWSIVYPEETNEVNVTGTLKVLQHSRDYGVKKFIFVSSSSLYGDQERFPTNEKDIPNPMCPYALTKLIGEQYCKLFEKLYGLQSNYIRPFNVYGTRMNPRGIYSGAVPKFIDLIKKGLTPTITGDGKQARDFIYVDDVVDLMISASKSKVSGEAFNAGSGKNISINDLFEMICKIMGKRVIPNHAPPVVEPGQTLADISKAKRMLGWEPKISLEEGLKRTVEGTI